MRSPKTWLHDDPEVVLMLQVQRDLPGAFAALAEHHGARLFARFFRLLGDRQEAEDLTQDVLLRVYRSRKRYQPRAKFSTWLYHITQNVARNAFRARRRRACLRLGRLEHLESADKVRSERSNRACPSQPLERSELAGVIRAAMSGLVGRQRAALEMRQFQNRSYAEIATALELTPKATKSLLYRARLQLRDFLTRLDGDIGA
jgi:RNA polymerase sigma-70 factor (ECF subfamily)